MTGTRDLRNEGCIQASTPLEGEGIFGDAAIAMTATTSSVILCSSWKLSAGAPVGRRAEFAAGRLHALGKFVWVGKHRRTANAAVEGRAIRALLIALDQDAIKAAMAAYRAFEARVVATILLTDRHRARLANVRSIRQAVLRPITPAR